MIWKARPGARGSSCPASADELPDPPEGIELVELPARKVAVVSFSGRATDAQLKNRRIACAAGSPSAARRATREPEFAFYNSPMIPGPLRRNEVWLALS